MRAQKAERPAGKTGRSEERQTHFDLNVAGEGAKTDRRGEAIWWEVIEGIGS
jgi:hypothetical protein